MPQFRKKPVIVEAIQWTGDNFNEMTPHLAGEGNFRFSGLEITTAKGTQHVKSRDWVVRGAAGDLYKVSPDLFTANYECNDDAFDKMFAALDARE